LAEQPIDDNTKKKEKIRKMEEGSGTLIAGRMRLKEPKHGIIQNGDLNEIMFIFYYFIKNF
jgi:hypothetical protein